MTMLAIIPARAGSKRLPHKNKKFIGGKPMVRWAQDCAYAAGLDTVLTTDDPATVNCMELRFGLSVLARPPELSTDTATSADVVLHVLRNYPAADSFVLLQPTSPLRTPQDLILAMGMFEESGASRLISVAKGSKQPNGALYMAHTDSFLKDPRFITNNTVHFLMPIERSIDIDTQEDFDAAMQYLESLKNLAMADCP